jgi:aspartyl-tRNA(Asn)/glutamyl-tRNA(Gln) amidotransferase subunit C
MAKQLLTANDTKKISKLANLTLTPDQVEKLTPQLSETIRSVEVLDMLPTKDVEGTFQVTGLVNIFREDEVEKSFSQEEALSNAKNKHTGFFVVPYVFQDEETA